MPDLIETLRAQHHEILDALTRLQSAGLGGAGAPDALQTLKGRLLAHLALEDRELYPELRRRAEQDREIAEMLRLFAADLDEVTGAATRFFADCDRGAAPMEIARGFGALIGRLRTRIRREEEILYRAYAWPTPTATPPVGDAPRA